MTYTAKDVAVIVPSRLQPNANPYAEHLYLDRALMSIKRQELTPARVIVVVDEGAEVPERFLVAPSWAEVLIVHAKGSGQAQALNAAVRALHVDASLVCFLEDDDFFRSPSRLRIALEKLNEGFDMVTSNQRESSELGNYVRINDFPTPSGWLLKRDAVKWSPWFNEGLKYHVDTWFLGEANRAELKRLHLVEADHIHHMSSTRRQWLANVSKHSTMWEHPEPEPLVERTCNPEGGMAQIAKGGEAGETSKAEHDWMQQEFGMVPW